MPADVKAARRAAYKIERREFDLVSLRSLLIGPKAWTDVATSLALNLAEPRVLRIVGPTQMIDRRFAARIWEEKMVDYCRCDGSSR
jgi:hypothetical protein